MKGNYNEIKEGDALQQLKEIDSDSIDLLCTDPPYGYSFMNKDWDKAIVSVDTWKECLRVLKAGAFAFVMSAPRQDVLSRMIVNLQDVGFRTDFTSIYYSYASGFPKAANTFKMLQKRGNPKSELNGSYLGFQPKPAVEVILVVMKPLSQKSFVDQALSNGKGISWLDDCRIPFQNDNWHYRPIDADKNVYGKYKGVECFSSEKGRFPANLLVSDDALNDGKNYKSQGITEGCGTFEPGEDNKIYGVGLCSNTPNKPAYKDEGSYSRYFSLDSWYDNNRAQFIITPKASNSERNKGCEDLQLKIGGGMEATECQRMLTGSGKVRNNLRHNHHPTVKPIKLMSYLITMGSRENDIVLDPFCGSGTTLIAAHQLNRRWIGIELSKEYAEIARKRIEPYLIQQKLI